MREKTKRAILATLGEEAFVPTQDQRDMVKLLAFNRVPHPRIATILGISEWSLQVHFPKELDLAEDMFTAKAASRVLELMEQEKDLGVALRASELVLKTRLAIWREPKQAETQEGMKRISDMSLDEVEAEIDRLERAKARAAASEEDDPPRTGKPH